MCSARIGSRWAYMKKNDNFPLIMEIAKAELINGQVDKPFGTQRDPLEPNKSAQKNPR